MSDAERRAWERRAAASGNHADRMKWLLEECRAGNPNPLRLAQLEQMYASFFGLSLDFAQVVLPPHRDGFGRLLIVAKGMTAEILFRKCAELFPATKSRSRGELAVQSDRNADQDHYAVWARDCIEADQEHRDRSAEAFANMEPRLTAMTLEERLVFELLHFHQTRRHLDLKTVTICAGSRFPRNMVPTVDIHGMRAKQTGLEPELQIGSCRLDKASAKRAVREVVALPAGNQASTPT